MTVEGAKVNPYLLQGPSTEGLFDFIPSIIEKKREQKKSYYEAEKNAHEELDKHLSDIEGADYDAQLAKNQSLRDRLTEHFRSNKKKNLNTPEFQSILRGIRDEAASFHNSIKGSHAQMRSALDFANSDPNTKKADVLKYVLGQSVLPPDKRDKNILDNVSKSSKFLDPYSLITSKFANVKPAQHLFTVDEPNYRKEMATEYNPAFYGVKDNKVVYNPDETIVDRALEDPRFTDFLATDLGIDPNTTTDKTFLNAEIRKHGLRFLEDVARVNAPHERILKFDEKTQPRIPAGTGKQNDIKAEVEALMHNIRTSPETALSHLAVNKNEEGYNDFVPYGTDEQGNVTSYKATFNAYDPKRKRYTTKEEVIPVSDYTSIQQLLAKTKAYTKGKNIPVTGKIDKAPSKGGGPKKGDKQQFAEGWGVFDGKRWVLEKALE